MSRWTHGSLTNTLTHFPVVLWNESGNKIILVCCHFGESSNPSQWINLTESFLSWVRNNSQPDSNEWSESATFHPNFGQSPRFNWQIWVKVSLLFPIELIYQSPLNFCEPAITQGSLNQCPVSIESPKATCFSEFKLLSTRNTTASYESTVLIRSSNLVNKPDHVTLGWFSWHPLFFSSGESTSLNHSQISTDSSALMIFPVHYLKSVSRFNCINPSPLCVWWVRKRQPASQFTGLMWVHCFCESVKSSH